MKNITISIDEETHRLACLRAEEMDTSVAELVRQYLTDFAADAKESERERRRRRMREVISKIRSNGGGLRMEDNLTREELYDRVAARSAAEDAKRERERRLKEVTDDIATTRPGFSVSDNLSREELYDRDVARAAAEEARRQQPRSA